MAFVAHDPHGVRSKLGRIVAAAVLLMACATLVLSVLDRMGLPGNWITGGLIAAVFLLLVATAMGCGTMRLRSFLVVDRTLSANVAGLSSAATLAWFVSAGLVGAVYGAGFDGLVLAAGLLGGFFIAATQLAPYLRRSGAYSLPDFLAGRFGGWPVRLLASLLLVCVGFPLLVSQFEAAGRLGEHLFGVPFEVSVWTSLALALVCALLGGLRSVVATGLALMTIVVSGLLGPLLFQALDRFGTVMPQVALGKVLSELAARTETLAAAGGLGAGLQIEPAPFSTVGALHFLGLALCLAMGTACLPQFAAPQLAARAGRDARTAAVVGLSVIAILALAAISYALLEKLAVAQVLAGLPLVDLDADTYAWVFQLGRIGALQLCGVPAMSPDAVLTACMAANPGGTLRWSDISIAGDAVLGAAPDLLRFSATEAGLLAAGLLAACLASLVPLVAGIANSLGYDLFIRIMRPQATHSGRMAVLRATTIGLAAGSAYVAIDGRLAIIPLVAASLNLAAASLFPALVLGIWWPRANRAGALAGMLAGAAMAAALLFLRFHADLKGATSVSLGPVFTPLSQVPVWPGSFGGLSGLAGAVVGAMVIAAVSLATKAPPDPVETFTRALWRPQSRQLLHPEEI